MLLLPKFATARSVSRSRLKSAIATAWGDVPAEYVTALENPVLVAMITEILFEPALAVTISLRPSLLKSAVQIPRGFVPVDCGLTVRIKHAGINCAGDKKLMQPSAIINAYLQQKRKLLMISFFRHF